MNLKKTFLTGVMATVAVTTLAGSLMPPAAPAQAQAPVETLAPEGITVLPDVFLGSETAPITVIEYASYTCVHCGTFANDVFPAIKAEYVDTGKVRFALREVYTDQIGLWSGLIAYEASDGWTNPQAYYDIAKDLFAQQEDWAFSSTTSQEAADKLKVIAAQHGVSEETFTAILNDRPLTETLAQTFIAKAGEYDITGTPTFVINGEVHPNLPLEDFREILDKELAKAE